MTSIDRASAIAALRATARLPLAALPTRLVRAETLEKRISPDGGPAIYLKMDAETGHSLGGNKVRKLEFELAPERLRDVTCLVTAGGPQSNHARVTAGAAARLGLECILILNGEAPVPPTANALLHHLFGADVRMVADRAARDLGMESARQEVEARGGRALVIPLGASTPLGALGYAEAMLEFGEQWTAEGSPGMKGRTLIYVASSSCGTLAGLLLGLALLDDPSLHLVGVSADATRDELLQGATRLALAAAALIGYSGALPLERLDATDAFVGPGYGIATPESDRATAVFGAGAGVVLDPVYTAKAAAAMIHAIEFGELALADAAVFWHTGGWPALFRG